jgi:hypothetical protein
VSAPIPSSEPQTLTAGETWVWTQTLSDYASTDGWTLKYALQARGQSLISIAASASGAGYLVNVAAATTVAYVAADYIWTAFVEKAAERYEVERGSITVLPSPLAAFGTTHASRTLALIESALEGRIPRGLEQTNIDGQALSRIPIADLFRLRSYYATLVAAENNKLALASGLPNRRNSFSRFRSVK